MHSSDRMFVGAHVTKSMVDSCDDLSHVLKRYVQ